MYTHFQNLPAAHMWKHGYIIKYIYQMTAALTGSGFKISCVLFFVFLTQFKTLIGKSKVILIRTMYVHVFLQIAR